jgi:hypothetical protein
MTDRRDATVGYDDAVTALTSIGPWVNNADTKIGLLAAAMTVLTGALVHQRPRVEQLIRASASARNDVALAFIALSAVSLVVSAGWLLHALRPRLHNDKPSRFAFPHLAALDVDVLALHDAEAVRKEAWIQAKTLAEIVLAKYRCFSHALSCAVVAGAGFVAWLLTVPTMR